MNKYRVVYEEGYENPPADKAYCDYRAKLKSVTIEADWFEYVGTSNEGLSTVKFYGDTIYYDSDYKPSELFSNVHSVRRVKTKPAAETLSYKAAELR